MNDRQTYNVDDQQAYYNIKALLDSVAERINTTDFIKDDPVQFPRRFTALRDIEIVALLVSHISWGRREMILRDAERLLVMMQGEPSLWIAEQAYMDVPDEQNIHRTFFGKSLKHFCRGLTLFYSKYGSLDEYAHREHMRDIPQPAWKLADVLNHTMQSANQGQHDKYCLPLQLGTTALKRLNMALRWLVRNDGIVDMGVWHSLTPAQLYIPLDVHVGNTARRLGLVHRRQDDRKTVVELTGILRRFRPSDPCYYDFALFGLGIEEGNTIVQKA